MSDELERIWKKSVISK